MAPEQQPAPDRGKTDREIHCEVNMFSPVSPDADFPKLEKSILDFWESEAIFTRSLAKRTSSPRFTFYEGPPTANNRPGLHHVWARVFKDVFCRYKTMRGFLVERKGGWDCHGLPVEVEVEKELGISSKRQIEELGVEEFNRLCRESVKRYVTDWEKMTRRIGFWLDTDDAYWTLSDDYVESVWWHLGKMWDSGLLYEDFKVVPYCPRCGTALSSAEVAQGYQDVADPSVYVRFPLKDEPGTSLLVWTTTPWTLISNVAVAAHPDATYVTVDTGTEKLILAKDRVSAVFGDEAPPISVELPGAELQGEYERPFDFLPEQASPAYTVVHADFVTMDEGTGLVHLAPAFGEIDREVGRRIGLPEPNPVDSEGKFDASVPKYQGIGVRDANPALVEDLDESGRLFRAEEFTHAYPHCWRCSTPLIYWARSSWYVKTTARRSEMLAENASIGWHPEHIRDGRFGDWLENNIDWSLSRDRFWGTPLPIWTCASGHDTFVRSRADLSELSGQDCSKIDPHRPFIDQVTFDCPECGEEARRVPSVIDAWFDSGAMPAAQWGYPYVEGSAERFERAFPADFICEAIDQTRGWFYSLLAVSTLVFDSSSYKNVLCLGHIVDADGKKMSKSLGNVIDPWTILDDQGADPLRWYFFSSGSPWTSSRVSMDAIIRSAGQFLLTLWNTYSFLVTYANADRWSPLERTGAGAQTVATETSAMPALDRWILSRTNSTAMEMTAAMDRYDALAATQAVNALVQDLSNWWVRRSRRRFWSARRGEGGGDDSSSSKESAYRTLYEVLLTISKLIAPFCPFVADEIYGNLTGRGRAASAEEVPVSVHLADWPTGDASLIDPELEETVGLTRKVVGLGRAARSAAGIKTRQPLAKALVLLPESAGRLQGEMESTAADELNVDQIEYVASLEELVDIRVKPDFSILGPRLGDKVRELTGALAAADARALARTLEAGRDVSLSVGGEEMTFGPSELQIDRTPREGFSVVTDAGIGVALDIELDESLRLRGVARDLIHALQQTRKEAGLNVDDRIVLAIAAPSNSPVADAIDVHSAEIASELLATSLADDPQALGSDAKRAVVRVAGENVEVALERA